MAWITISMIVLFIAYQPRIRSSFNDDYAGWQYTSCVIAPKKDNQSKTIESITVIMAYDLNVNTVSFDGISLKKEPCTTYTYDSYGNMTAVNATGNSEASFTYTAGTRNLTKSTTEDQGICQYTYNSNNLVTKIKNDGVSMSITYDARGNSTATTLASDSDTSIGSIKTSAAYSSDGSQLVSQTNSSGYVTAYTYDTYRNVSSTSDAASNTYAYQYYEGNDRMKTSAQPGKVSISYEYAQGKLTYITRGGLLPDSEDTQVQVYSIYHDNFGNTASVTVGNRTLASYLYGGGNGNLQSMTYGNGDTVGYSYDNLDRVTSEYWNGVEKYQYFYNAEGNLTKKLDVTTGKAVNYEYDSLGRLIHSSQNNGSGIVQQTEHLYDTSNRISSQSWQMGDTTYSESYTYDGDDGSLVSMSPAVGEDVTFSYDALKRLQTQQNDLIQQAYTYRDITAGSQTTTQIQQITYIEVHSEDSFTPFNIKYTYDNLGNIATVYSTSRPMVNATYGYDTQGQLVSETNYVGTYTYTYDTYGNIRSVSDGTTTHSYNYDDAQWKDLLTAYDGQSITYDAIGNPTSYYNGTRWTFTWQNGRQLASASKDGTAVSYTYDVAGIRDSKTVNGVTYNYITQNGQVVRQSWTENGTSHVMDFIYDTNGRPYAMVYDGDLYYYLLDQRGDVVIITDENGLTAARYGYDAWGNVIYAVGSMTEINPLRYRGYYYDVESGLYYLGSRYYDPVVKRFVNADDTSYLAATGTLISYNLFAYCENNPVNRTDDGGNLSFPNSAKVAIGAVATIAAVTITVATGGAALPMLAGVALSTAGGAISGYISGGKQGAVDGAANGFMWGGVGALASSAIGAVKAVSAARKGVTIGENMSRVRAAATVADTGTYKAMNGYGALKRIAGSKIADSLSYRHNKAFIQRMVKLGARVYDAGPKGKTISSMYYAMERTVTAGYWNYVKMW